MTLQPTTVETFPWGTAASGEPLQLFKLSSGTLRVEITNLGAAITSLFAPDRNGVYADVVLGYNTAAEYEADRKNYFGAIAGRYANRIAAGRFAIDGEHFQIPCNNGEATLHGGPEGFDRKVWAARAIADGVELTLTSPDGDMGYPGTLAVTVRYTLAGDALHIAYTATTSKPTVVNLTNHAYFNLAGEASGTHLAQRIRIDADRYLPIDRNSIPLGEQAPVAGTPFDLRAPVFIGARLAEDDPQLEIARGYDHNFVLNTPGPELHFAAEVVDPENGRRMVVETTEPGIQFYSGNFLDGSFTGKAGKPYERNAGFCLETQHFPDSPNVPEYPSTVLRPGDTFRSETVYAFSVADES